MKQMIKNHSFKFIAALMLISMLFGIFPAAQSVSAYTMCDAAQFVADVTVPDGTVYAAGTAFTKTWRLRNTGSCTWTTSYKAVFVAGSQMSAPVSVNLPTTVYPGQTVDVSVSMVAPSTAGTYQGDWMLQNASGTNFGIGSYASRSFWVEIVVPGTSSTTGYDFDANAASAAWSSGAGAIVLNGTDPYDAGVAKVVSAPILENGVVDGAGILVAPQNVYGGYIQGIFPAYTVQSGDRFTSIINCEYNATNCYVNFKLKYQIGTGPIQTLWSFTERYEGLYYNASVDLSSLVGQSVKFILYVDTAGYAYGDRAVWASPAIVNGGSYIPVPPPPGPYIPPAAACDRAAFISDVNYPDGSYVTPGQAFTKTWRIKNVGSCTWTTSYSLVYVSGSQMSGASPIPLTMTVAPNTTVDLSVNLVAPTTAGNYRGYWMLRNNYSQNFGIGSAGTTAWWVDVNVSGTVPVPTPTPSSGVISFDGDFTHNTDAMTWYDGNGVIVIGSEASEGTVRKITNVNGIQMEDETTYYQNALLMHPDDNGFVRGVFPSYTVLSGDSVVAKIGCQFQKHTCDVIYKVGYLKNGTITYFADAFNEVYDGATRDVSVDISSIAGQTVQLVLEVQANGENVDDFAVWLAPHVE